MIRWCAYCQSYLGECEPFADFSLTHCICAKCVAGGKAEEKGVSGRMRSLTSFFQALRSEVRTGIKSDPGEWVKKGFAMGVKPEDLLIGLIQPALYEIGELWSKGEVTVAIEHRFSSFAEEMVSAVYRHYPELAKNRQAKKPDVLLTNADGNYHTLGLKFLEVSLLSRGLKTYTVLPGLPGREILELVRALKPKTLGLSVSLLPQLRAVREFAVELTKIPKADRPLLLLGGLPLKEGLVLPPELQVRCCRGIQDLDFSDIRPNR